VPVLMLSENIDLETYFDHTDAPITSVETSAFPVDNGELKRVRDAVEARDKSPLKAPGQISEEQTTKMLEALAALVAAMPSEKGEPAKADGHVQKTDPKDYIELTKDAEWDLDDYMDGTNMKNSELIAAVQVGDDTIFMHRAGIGEGGVWPHALIRNVEIDLDKTPFISWKQKEPPADFKPAGFPERDPKAKYVLNEKVRMPMGFALRITDNETRRMVLLKETHTPPWFNYGAKDLRELFDVRGGKRIFTIKYYPLGVYITGMPGSGFAIPGDYHLLDFVRAESE
jgi:hypothetical protein